MEVRRDTGNISVMVDVECENDRIDPWAEANISAFLTLTEKRDCTTRWHQQKVGTQNRYITHQLHSDTRITRLIFIMGLY